MPATINRLKTRPDRHKAAVAARYAQLLAEFEELARELGRKVPEGICETRAELEREALAEAGWTFVMLNPKQFNAVRRWLREHSTHPAIAVDLWSELFDRLDPKTGEILASRAELAELVGTHPREVSRIMSELARIGAVQRHREPANGPVRYYLNPLVGTCLPKPARELAQREAPKLRLVPSA